MSCRHQPYDLTVLSSAARTASPTPTPASITDPGAKGCIVHVNATAKTATPSVVVAVEGYDPASDSWYTILASAAITDAGTTLLHVYPGVVAAANSRANFRLPRTWRVTATHADGDSLTYSVGVSVLP